MIRYFKAFAGIGAFRSAFEKVGGFELLVGVKSTDLLRRLTEPCTTPEVKRFMRTLQKSITDAARCLHTRMDKGVSTGTHRGERAGVLVEDKPRAILNPFKENTWQNGRRIKEPNEPMFTLTVTDRHGVVHHGRIRRLMPIEAWQLQGFTDDDQFNKVTATGMSDAQPYKQAGNSITVIVIEKIAQNLLEFDKKISV